MITETARVVAVEPHQVWVETLQVSACESCKAKSACGQSVINKASAGKRQHLAVDTREVEGIFAVDDQVKIGIPEESLMRGIVWAYMVPLSGLFLGAYLGLSLFPDVSHDLTAIVAGSIGFISSLLIVRRFLSSGKAQQQLQPRLLGRC